MMNRTARRLDAWTALILAVLLTGCSEGVALLTVPSPSPPATPTPPAPPVSTSLPPPETIEAVGFNALASEVVDQDCTPAEKLDSGTPLFHNERTYRFLWTGECSPEELRSLPAPDGRQLTAGDWVGAAGEVTITCVDEGTRYDFRFQGLIPNGMYSIWHNLRRMDDADGVFGYGALASHPGDIRNAFMATASGTADLSLTGTAGRMTMYGFAPACTLPVPSRPPTYSSWFWIFSLVYHKDNRAPGDELPLDTAVGQLAFERPVRRGPGSERR